MRLSGFGESGGRRRRDRHEVARKDKQLLKAIAECKRRGESAFGSGKLYIERYIENPRHVEIQVLADTHGTPCTCSNVNAASSGATRK